MQCHMLSAYLVRRHNLNLNSLHVFLPAPDLVRYEESPGRFIGMVNAEECSYADESDDKNTQDYDFNVCGGLHDSKKLVAVELTCRKCG